jgi:hypothetical protein
MMNAVVACSLVMSLSSSGSQTSGREPSPLAFQQADLSKNMSQLLSSNANHFWLYNRDPRVLKDLANYVAAEGVISGDPHLGNVTVIPVKTNQGKEQLRFLNVDFDDGGRGPFALEFARSVTMAKAASKDIKIKDLFESYLEGLNGRVMAMPKRIAQAENLGLQGYEALRTKYVAKKMIDGRFKYKEGEIEKWEGHPNRSEVAPFFQGSTVIEVAKRPMERGGSLEGLRLWVLLQDGAGVQRIIELKQYQETALSEYSPQADARERIESLHELYWQGLDPRAYDIAEIQGTRFWIREKKVEILTYKNKAEEDEGRIYLASLMGMTQAKQAAAAKYAAKISKDPERFKEAVKEYVHAYLEVAKDSFE